MLLAGLGLLGVSTRMELNFTKALMAASIVGIGVCQLSTPLCQSVGYGNFALRPPANLPMTMANTHRAVHNNTPQTIEIGYCVAIYKALPTGKL